MNLVLVEDVIDIVLRDEVRRHAVVDGHRHGLACHILGGMSQLCDGKYDKETDTGIRFDDPDIGIEWPIGESVAIHSERDMKLSSFKEFDTSFDMT